MQEILKFKPGVRLISDETADYVDQQNIRKTTSKDYFKGCYYLIWREIEAAVPVGSQEKELKFLWDGNA